MCLCYFTHPSKVCCHLISHFRDMLSLAAHKFIVAVEHAFLWGVLLLWCLLAYIINHASPQLGVMTWSTECLLLHRCVHVSWGQTEVLFLASLSGCNQFNLFFYRLWAHRGAFITSTFFSSLVCYTVQHYFLLTLKMKKKILEFFVWGNNTQGQKRAKSCEIKHMLTGPVSEHDIRVTHGCLPALSLNWYTMENVSISGGA